MSIYRIEKTLRVPISLDEAWAFFSNPRNLALITPPDLGLIPSGEVPSETYAGLIITYRVKPLLGIPMDWVTEITHVDPGRMFVDEQRFGPYAFWHHQHHFAAIDEGVELVDIVHYKLPLGPLSGLIRGTVQRQLDAIFSYRERALEERFGTVPH